MNYEYTIFKFTDGDYYLRMFKESTHDINDFLKSFSVTNDPMKAKRFDHDELPHWLDYLNGKMVTVNVEVEE